MIHAGVTALAVLWLSLVGIAVGTLIGITIRGIWGHDEERRAFIVAMGIMALCAITALAIVWLVPE